MDKIKMPFKCHVKHSTNQKVRIPQTGDLCELSPEAFTVYHAINGAAYLMNTAATKKQWEFYHRRLTAGRNWFLRRYPKQYQTLLV